MTSTLAEPVALTHDAGQPEAPQPKRRQRVLMLTHRLPYPPDRGDRIRSFHMLKLLSKHFDMAIACTSDEAVWLQHHQLLSTMAKRVDIMPISPMVTKFHAAKALLSGRAVTPACHYRTGLAQTILQWDEQWPFDAVLTFCTGMIDYARVLMQRRARHASDNGVKPLRHVLDLVDVDSLKWSAYARSSWPPMSWVYAAEARRLGRIEAGRDDHFDAVTVVSPAEADAYRQQIGDHPNLTVVGNGVDLDYFAPAPDADSKTIVFVGVLNYRPNSEGVTWFVQKVMPLLLEKVPEARFQIVGRHPTPKLQELAGQPGVEVVGSVPDVRAYLHEAAAVIAPLRIARGVQNKVLEAMACARAVVCSPGAAKGIDAVDGQHLLVADEPEQWADTLAQLLTDPALRQRIAQSARTHVEQRYTWQKCLEPMVKLLAGPGAGGAAGGSDHADS